MVGLLVGRPGSKAALVEISTGAILVPDFVCRAVGADAGVFREAGRGRRILAIYLKGRNPILMMNETPPM